MPDSNLFRTLIADDEPIIRQHLKQQLTLLWPELTICAEAADGQQALQLIEQEQPNIVFLDIRMPGLSGLQVAERIKIACCIVFVTAYDEYAVDAFEQAAVDYLLKPINETRLQKTIDRLKLQLEKIDQSPTQDLLAKLSNLFAPNTTRYLQWIKAAKNEDIRVISVAEILYFEADEKYTSVITPTETLLIRKPIKELEEELDPELFWRVHRSIIVNVKHIQVTRRDFAGRLWIEMRNHDKALPVSRSFAYRFKQM